MPFLRTWTEELVCEYLELKGYSIRTNLPFPAEKGGKRGELDILAFKVKNNRPEIIHVEVGIPGRLRFHQTAGGWKIILNDLCQADAIQIQTAMAEKCDFIVTADEQLAESGEKLGREQSPSRTAEDQTRLHELTRS